MDKQNWFDVVKEHKLLFTILTIGFFLIEIQIFAFASLKSGRHTYTQVLNKESQIIYEVKGTTLTNFNKYYFENTYGPISGYLVKLEIKETDFPVRPWFAASVCIPVGIMLLLSFVLKSATVFLFGNQKKNDHFGNKGSLGHGLTGTGPENMLMRISRYNIYMIGVFIFAGGLLFWLGPELLLFVGRAGTETIVQFKWFFLAFFIGLFILFAWFMYMKYRLAHRNMELQLQMRKYEMELEYAKTGQLALESSQGYRSVPIEDVHQDSGSKS